MLLTPTARQAITSMGALGMFAAITLVHSANLLDHRQSRSFSARALLVGLAMTVGTFGGSWALRRHLSRGTGTPGARLAETLRSSRTVVAAVALVLLLMPFVADGPGAVVLVAVATATLATVAALLSLAVLEVLERSMRPAAVALGGVFFGPVGALGGLVLVGSIDRRFGAAVAFAMLAVPGLALARSLGRLSAGLSKDVERAEVARVEQEALQAGRDAGAHVPLLSCRGVDFSYGQLQVLFGVDFTVDVGEMVALLGTNGAGKSTLLRVISGLGLPSAGRVHFGSHDITYLDPERRVHHGIVQIPGGKAVFGPMTVIDNLRVFGHSLPRSSTELEAGIEATFEAFPRLAERRNQLASTLSGGEQQMLALGKALIVRPKLLLIDELSLGLAPIIVGQLLEMVRRINAEGTAVVLVEQSVNVALSLVDHAYFMEKGQIRFDGPAKELLERRDLLRSVFLEGVEGAA